MSPTTLLSLPKDILVLLPDFLHNIEDYTNLGSTCRGLRDCMSSASSGTILRLAVAQTKIFFRPSPHFLVAATARELGHWARESDANEAELAEALRHGTDGLLDLAVEHCGLTMPRIRELHQMRFDVINPVVDIIDKCVGSQWYATPGFWNGGVDDAYTIDSDPPECVFHLAIYGELFGPDLESFLDQEWDRRRLSVVTRLEYIKYCVPDFANVCMPWGGSVDDRLKLQPTGPYTKNARRSNELEYSGPQHNVALTWVLRSSRWRPHFKAMRTAAGCEDWEEDFEDGWWYVEDDERDWRQRLWENVMVCQGLEGLEMIRPDRRERWFERVRNWKEKIGRLEKEPEIVRVGNQATHEYAYLKGDLRTCASGYVGGT